MALINLTNVKITLNDVKRNLFLEDNLTIKFLNISKVLLELESGWYIDKNPERDSASPEFFKISIAAEDLELDKVIPLTTSIKIGTDEYGSFQYDRPRGATKEWILKVYPAQGMKRDV